jgi:WhiB family redox-sensing transcriptional regulator
VAAVLEWVELPDDEHDEQHDDVERLMQQPGIVDELLDLVRWLRPSWHARAACRSASIDAFFVGKGKSIEPARRICADCPVRLDCLQYAMEHDDVTGVWGGFSYLERRHARRNGASAAEMLASG